MKWFNFLCFSLLLGNSQFVQASESQKPIQSVTQTLPWVALTFDDGPDPRFTKEVVDLLDKHKERASFFFVGDRALTYPDTTRYVVQHGDEIANHTFSHPDMRALSEEQIYREIKQGEAALYQITGLKSPWFRAPSGVFNERVRKAANRANVQLVGWYEDTRDWSNIGPGRIYSNAMKTLKPGHIILFHDCCGRDRKKTVAALDRVLTEIEKRGYRCVTLSELMGGKIRGDHSGHSIHQQNP